MFPVGLGEDRADDRGDHILAPFRHDREHVAHEMDPASLPRRALEHGPDRFLQTRVGVRHDQLHPAQATRFQRPKKCGSKPFVLGITNVEAKNFPPSTGGNTNGDDDGLGDDAVIDPRLAVGGVEEDIREIQC